MFQQVFKNMDDILWKDAGCSSELDYAEQSSWILFLKWLDDYQKEKDQSSALKGERSEPILQKKYQWSSWAIVKNKEGKVDFNKILTGPDLKKFIDEDLFPYLASFKTKSDDFNTLEYKIGEIFSELRNKLQDGYTLRDVINEVDKLKFNSSEEKHELSALYEEKIKNMGNAGKNGGEYYTPRPLIKTIVKIINPTVEETIYDGAVGSAGFLIEAFNYINTSKSLTTSELKKLQTKTFYGKEKKGLAYILGIMNMILHGIESPNIIHKNTLEENIIEIQESQRVDVVLANPPFGGKEKTQIQENFPIKSAETAYLFLQHFIKILKVGGRCGIVIKNTFLSNDDASEVNLRKQLLEECNLHTILDMPVGTFQGAGVKTVILFFEKGKSTKSIWYYQLNLKRNLGKRTPLIERDLEEFVEFSKTKKESENSWNVKIESIDKENFFLNKTNPNKIKVIDSRTPQEILKEIEEHDVKSKKIIEDIKGLL